MGLFQLALGLARLGALVDFVSHSVMVGFMAGAATLIVMSQIDNALGVDLPHPSDIVAYGIALFSSVWEVDWRSLIIAFISLSSAVVIKRFWPRWPNYLFALLIGLPLLALTVPPDWLVDA